VQGPGQPGGHDGGLPSRRTAKAAPAKTAITIAVTTRGRGEPRDGGAVSPACGAGSELSVCGVAVVDVAEVCGLRDDGAAEVTALKATAGRDGELSEGVAAGRLAVFALAGVRLVVARRCAVAVALGRRFVSAGVGLGDGERVGVADR
jgi:hypothetical protein